MELFHDFSNSSPNSSLQFLEYMKSLLANPSIFNPHMTPTTKALVDFLDHDGTLAMQVKCFLLESKVQQLTYAYRELQQSRELTEQVSGRESWCAQIHRYFLYLLTPSP